MNAFIPYGTQWIEEDDIAAVVDVLRHGHLTQGPKVTEFEKAIASKVGAKHCIAFCNATAALHCAVKALEIPAGKQGVTSPNTFVASANCLPYNGLVAAFADIDARTFNVTAETLEKAITTDTGVLIPVHFAGQVCDMDAIGQLARKHGLPVIEDAAHAVGSCYADGSLVGNCRNSAMTIFSFHPVKTLTTGEGGAITTNDDAVYQKLLLLRSHGITKDPALLSANPGPWYYEQVDLGFNYRITDMQCALGLSQLAKLDRSKQRRQEIVAAYNEGLKGCANVVLPLEKPGLSSCLHLYVLQIDFNAVGKDRAQVMKELQEYGVGTQVHYIPVYTQPWYRKTFGYGPGLCPVAEAYYAKALSIPLYPKMSAADVQRVIEAVQKVLNA